MKLYARGEADIEVSDGSISTATPLEVTVAAATASKFVLTAADATPTAGEGDNLTITAIDAYGNLATSYTGSKSLTFSGATTIGTSKPTVANSSGTATAFGTATAITFTAGVATVTSSKNGLMTLYKAESPSISVTEGTVTTATPLEVTVAPAAAAKFVLTATSATPTAGEADNLATTAQDTYGNVATSYTGSKASPSRGPRQARAESTHGLELGGDQRRLRQRHDYHLQRRRRHGQRQQKRRDEALQERLDKPQSHRRHPAHPHRPDRDRRRRPPRSSSPSPPHRRLPRRAARDNLTITALDSYENTATAIRRFQEPHLLGGGDDRRQQTNGRQQRAARRQPSELRPRSPSPPASPR